MIIEDVPVRRFDKPGAKLCAALIHEPRDPFAVRLALSQEISGGVIWYYDHWVFGRELLLDGTCRLAVDAAGRGDVRCWTDHRDSTLHVELQSPAGRAHLLLDWRTVGVFLRKVYDITDEQCTAEFDKQVDRFIAEALMDAS